MEKIGNSCIVDTVYALALYLLYMPLAEVRRTRFFVGSSIPQECDEKLGCVVRFDTSALRRRITPALFVKTWLRCFYLRLFKISHTKVYGQDHIGFFGFLTGFKSYVLLEDAPGVYTRVLELPQFTSLNRKMSIIEIAIYAIRYGMMPSKSFGQSSSCITRIITYPSDASSPLLANRAYELVDFNNLWAGAKEEKKRYIMSVFGVTDSVVDVMSSCDTVFLTQPYREECHLTDDEWRAIIDQIVGEYSRNILIKVHPRDKFDYERHYPYLHVMKQPIPMQLLAALGVTVKRAVTINSSAIYSFPDNVDKVILGAQINEKIKVCCGQ